MSNNNQKSLLKCVVLFFALIMFQETFSQAGIDKWSPDDIFKPVQNQYYQSAKFSLRSIGNNSNIVLSPSAYINCLENIERVYTIEGNYAGALDLLIGQDEPENADLAKQFYMPEFTENMQEVIARIGKKINTDLIRAKFYENLSAIYNQIGNHDEGLAYQLKSQEILKKQNSLHINEYINASLLLGERYISAGKLDSAHIIYNSIGIEMSFKRDTSNYISYLFLKALILQKQNKSDEAINLYKEIFSYKKKHPQYYEMALDLSRLLTQTKQYQLADSVLRRNFSVLHQLGYMSVIFDQMDEALCENLLYMGKTELASKLLISLGDWILYKTQINSMGMSEDEEISYTKRTDEVFNVIYTILSNNNNKENQTSMFNVLLIELQYRYQVLLNKKELLKQAQPKKYYYLDKSGSYISVPSIKAIIAREYSLPYCKRHLNIDSLEEISEQADRKLSAQGFGLSPFDKSKDNIMTMATEPGTANIEFVRFIYKTPNPAKDSAVYAAFVFEQSLSTAAFVPLCGEAQILKMLKDENGNEIDEDQLSNKLYSSTSKYSNEFYKLIWAPMYPYLKNMDNINYSAAGIINNIAVGALYDGKDYLSNIHSIHFFSSLPAASIYNIAYEKPVAINEWGNMNYNAETAAGGVNIINNKPGNYNEIIQDQKQKKDADTSLFHSLGDCEVTELKKICNVNQVSFKSCELSYATEDSFKKESSMIKGVLHISTHGFYIYYNKKKEKELLPGNFIAANRNPLFRSGLAFAGVNYYWKKGTPPPDNQDDGILTPYEIEDLDLHNVQLVTLSACETGLGETTYSEGNQGLQRAFKLAGAHYVLVSLWKVNAKITAELLSLFYDNWLKGEFLSEALRNAQHTVQKEHPEPYFWAGFVLIE